MITNMFLLLKICAGLQFHETRLKTHKQYFEQFIF